MKPTISFLAALAAAFLLTPPPPAHAQIAVQIGPPPECPYGYYGWAPYNCAPYGYYGPDWFNDGIFVGAGPWFQGPDDFRGWVNNRYDPHHGYRGGYPRRGEHDQWQGSHWQRHPEGGGHFRGNEMRDGRGHVVQGNRGDHGGHPHS